MHDPSVSRLELPSTVAPAYLWHHKVCPTWHEATGHIRLLAAPDALLDDAVPELADAFDAIVSVERTDWSTVNDALKKLTGDSLAVNRREDEKDEDSADLRDLAAQPPVVRFVNSLIRSAVDAHASDIHIEAGADGAQARLRVDGILVPTDAPPARLHNAVVSRVKLLADLDIAEHRVPQDGRIRVRMETRDLDLRVSTIPTMHGESVVLRLLESHGRPGDLDELGISAEVKSLIADHARKPHGMFLVTGPTGSGKTTTIYAALHCRDLRREKVITIEDPIEYHLSGVVQVPVRADAGVTVASALRSILRQDPDVIMVGEMRDGETANLSVQAALTGHMVFSTLHTTDSLTAIPRLIDLGVPPYLVSATLDGVLAQRLVRKNCANCAEEVEGRTMWNPDYTADTAPLRYLRGRGCARCRGTGYRGRMGLFELLLPNEELRDLISHGGARSDLLRAGVASRSNTLLDDGMRKVGAGLTTIEEVRRIIQH